MKQQFVLFLYCVKFRAFIFNNRDGNHTKKGVLYSKQLREHYSYDCQS